MNGRRDREREGKVGDMGKKQGAKPSILRAAEGNRVKGQEATTVLFAIPRRPLQMDEDAGWTRKGSYCR